MAWITGSFRGKALAALVVTIAAITAGAEARVGVTSAAEGDPLGVELILTKEFLNNKAEAFVRLKRSLAEASAEGGVRIEW